MYSPVWVIGISFLGGVATNQQIRSRTSSRMYRDETPGEDDDFLDSLTSISLDPTPTMTLHMLVRVTFVRRSQFCKPKTGSCLGMLPHNTNVPYDLYT